MRFLLSIMKKERKNITKTQLKKSKQTDQQESDNTCIKNKSNPLKIFSKTIKENKNYLATNITTNIISLLGAIMPTIFTHHPPHFCFPFFYVSLLLNQIFQYKITSFQKPDQATITQKKWPKSPQTDPSNLYRLFKWVYL